MAESIRNINGGRILWCCDHYGIPVDELASSFGLKEDVLARIRQGKKLDLPLILNFSFFLGKCSLFYARGR